jgi:hypothetical protein
MQASEICLLSRVVAKDNVWFLFLVCQILGKRVKMVSLHLLQV